MAEATLELMAASAKAAGLNPTALVQPTDHWVRLNGIRFHYLDWGNPELPHVVLLHGGSLTAHTWDMAALVLRDRYHLVALDQRGHGDTEWTPEDQLDRDNGELMLEDTRQFIEQLGYERLVLVGMSMGGMNAIRHAARYPERLVALGIVDVAPETMREGQIEMEQFRSETETLSQFEDFLDRAMKFMPHRAPEHLRYSLTHSLRRTTDGWTWKQDHRRRPQMELGQAEMERRHARVMPRRFGPTWRRSRRPLSFFAHWWARCRFENQSTDDSSRSARRYSSDDNQEGYSAPWAS